MIYDSHCHYPALNTNRAHLKIAVPAVTLEDISVLSNYRKINPQAKIGIGCHPWHIQALASWLNSAAFKAHLANLITHYQIDFIGETGLDKNKPYFELQITALQTHLELASELQLPIVIHCVRAANELLQLLKKFSNLTGIVHAYNGNREVARELWKKNMFIGVGSIILNANSQLGKSIHHIPDAQIILESDAPYMPAFKHAQSSSADCLIYAQRLAQLKHASLFATIANSNANWMELFGSKA